MGVWGTGLYSGDFAIDLRSTISAVARLPFDGDKLVDILCQTEPTAATNPDDADHTIFWLVVADQFAKRAIVCGRARDRALAMIESGADIAVHERLGMQPSDLRKRRKTLEEVRTRITAPLPSGSARSVLKKPQAFLMDVGDVFVYPTFGGRCRNAYFASKESDRLGTKAPPWTQNGWAAMVIVDRGRAFGFLSWYRPLTVSMATVQRPTLAALRADVLWRLARAGTCSAVHFGRMELEKIGNLAIDNDKLRRSFPDMRPGTSQAVENISIANTVGVGPYLPAALMPRPGEPPDLSRGRPYPTILGIEQILSG
ncbi:MAG TPA: hypothetical protein VJT33_06975 [bacterium]|nr:hypothetical protein [bacterium]